MQVEVIQEGKVLRTITHEGISYVQAPAGGSYSIRARNTSPKRRMAVISVDGINVINGEDAGHGGPGYVLNPWEASDIPGWRRDNGKVAAFEFKEQSGSYANQSGRGTSNVGVIGVAVFDEKVDHKVPQPIILRERHHHHYPQGWPWYPYTITWGNGLDGSYMTDPNSMTLCCDTEDVSQTLGSCGVLRSCSLSADVKGGVPISADALDVGTSYGAETTFHTRDVDFTRASEYPAQVVSLRYATYQRLKEWGVPVDQEHTSAPTPNPFPASDGSCPAPAGWRG